MSKGKRRYLVALVEGTMCSACRERVRQREHYLCWPCERARFSAWMWNA